MKKKIYIELEIETEDDGYDYLSKLEFYIRRFEAYSLCHGFINILDVKIVEQLLDFFHQQNYQTMSDGQL